MTYRSDRECAEHTADLVRKAGRRAEVPQLDLTRLPGAADVIDEPADALGGVGVLVNCAGTGIATPVVDTGWEQWREVLAVDLDGPFLCAQRAARRMLAADWPAGQESRSSSRTSCSAPFSTTVPFS